MRKSIDTYVEVIAHYYARYIIEGEYDSIADYCLNCGVTDKYDLIDFFDDSELDCGEIPDDKVIELREYLIANYNYLPFDDYFRLGYTTAGKTTDNDGNNACFHTIFCDALRIVLINNNKALRCDMLDANKVFNEDAEQWQDVLEQAGLQNTEDLRVLRVFAEDCVYWIVIYDDLIY